MHLERSRPCSQIDAPPHSLHAERRRPCLQISDPPHSLHRLRHFPCGQALHTLHFDRYFTPCSHGPFVRGALFRFVPCFVNSSPPLSVSSTSPSSSRVTLTFGRQIAGIPSRAPSKCPAGRRRLKLTFVISPSFGSDDAAHAGAQSSCARASRGRPSPQPRVHRDRIVPIIRGGAFARSRASLVALAHPLAMRPPPPTTPPRRHRAHRW